MDNRFSTPATDLFCDWYREEEKRIAEKERSVRRQRANQQKLAFQREQQLKNEEERRQRKVRAAEQRQQFLENQAEQQTIADVVEQLLEAVGNMIE